MNENKLLKMKNSDEKDENNENKIEEEKNEQEQKIKKLTEKYENKIELINSKKNLLKNALEKMNSQFHLFDINKIIKKSSSHNINISSDNKKSNYKKIIPKKSNDLRESKRNDIDRMNSFLDISIINNKEDENNISKDKFGIMKTSVWDVSAINVKDISFIEKKDDF